PRARIPGGRDLETVRIGVLGAAAITPRAMVVPARSVDRVSVVAVAARDRERARVFAEEHDIPVVHRTYEQLVLDPDIDAVYNALPNTLHAEWTIAAVEAGKHVLCEKPFTANASEAARVATVARGTGCVVMEAVHSLYHPLAARIQHIVDSGEL